MLGPRDHQEKPRIQLNVFGVDVPTAQSQSIESTQGTHRTTSAPRTPNPDVDEGESSAQRKSTVIRLRIPPRRSPRRSTRLTSPTPIPTAADAEDIILQDTIQLSIAKQKSRDELKAKQNVEKVEEHLIAEEIEKLVEGTENVENELTVTDPKPSSLTPSSSSPKPTLSMSQHILSLFKPKTGRFKRYKSFFDELQGRYSYLFEHLKTRFMPRKKFHVLAQHLQEVMEDSLFKMVDARVKELTKTQVPIYVAQGLIMERQHSQADVAKMIVDVIQQERENLRAEISSQINNANTNHIPSQVDSSVRFYMSSHILHVHSTQASQASVHKQQYQLYLTMKDNPQLQHDDLPIWLAIKIKFE
ncbi:hypothetical protein Tco_0487742 [Tanacetum coccineum]